MVTHDHRYSRVTLTRDIADHRAGDCGVLVELDAAGHGVVEFAEGRGLAMIAAAAVVPARPARTPAR